MTKLGYRCYNEINLTMNHLSQSRGHMLSEVVETSGILSQIQCNGIR